MVGREVVGGEDGRSVDCGGGESCEIAGSGGGRRSGWSCLRDGGSGRGGLAVRAGFVGELGLGIDEERAVGDDGVAFF